MNSIWYKSNKYTFFTILSKVVEFSFLVSPREQEFSAYNNLYCQQKYNPGVYHSPKQHVEFILKKKRLRISFLEASNLTKSVREAWKLSKLGKIGLSGAWQKIPVDYVILSTVEVGKYCQHINKMALFRKSRDHCNSLQGPTSLQTFTKRGAASLLRP